MGPGEVLHRSQDALRRRVWRHRPPEQPKPVQAGWSRPVVPADLASGVDEGSRAALVAEAEELLAGRWTMFGRDRSDMTEDLDYFVDFVSGTRAPDDRYSLAIDHRNEAKVGNVKFVWEAARHQHLSLLAAAFAVTGDDRFAKRIDAELRNYWRANPFLVGIHWTSGIELGLRLISWTWIRRLLDSWDGVVELFEENPTFVEQLGRHHQWLAALGSHGSSANNHLIAEAAGQFVASSAFSVFETSEQWQAEAAETLARELESQTFADGLNRELASDYHGFVLELGLVAWVEAVLVEHPVADRLAPPLIRAADALQAVVDERGHPHRQGDSDDAHGWLVDPTGYDRWASLRRTAAVLVEPAAWWPAVPPAGTLAAQAGHTDDRAASDVRTSLVGQAMERVSPRPGTTPARPIDRPAQFPDTGLTLLRTEPQLDDGEPELWCAFDHGPLGFLSTAAHGHADALAVEIRCGGVEIVADPGTYCYHGEPLWRDWFRSTEAHATVTVGGHNQSDLGGPFLWTRKAEATLEASGGLGTRDDVGWCRASHDGYDGRGWKHRREVRLDRTARTITIVDEVRPVSPDRETGNETADQPPAEPIVVSMAWPLGVRVKAELDRVGKVAHLSWPFGLQSADDDSWPQARVTLDSELSWSIARGSESPPGGWYSARFGTKQPATTLVGRSSLAGQGVEYTTTFAFLPRRAVGS